MPSTSLQICCLVFFLVAFAESREDPHRIVSHYDLPLTKTLNNDNFNNNKRQHAQEQHRIRIGTTQVRYGPTFGWGSLQNNLWKLFLEKNLTYVLNGVSYGIELISYVDDQATGSDGAATTAALAERLILVDKVQLLISSYQGNTFTSFLPIAEKYGVPCMNVGSFEYPFQPAGSFQWIVNIMPDISTLGFACGEPLYMAGARNFSLVRSDIDVTLDTFTFIVVAQLERANLTFTKQILNITDDMFKHNSSFVPVFDALKQANPDLVVFDFRQQGNIHFIDLMRQNNYNPSAYYVWATGSYPEVRAALGWKDGHALISESYSPYLKSPDPLWTNTAEYDNLYQSRFNLSSSFADATLAAALTILDQALKSDELRTSADLSPMSLRAALLAVSVSTVVGPLSFTNGTVNRFLYCLQHSPNATVINTIWPKNFSFENITYPAKIEYPPKYFEQLRPKKDHRVRNILLIILIPIGGILLIACVAMCFLKIKYHAIFINKSEFFGKHETYI